MPPDSLDGSWGAETSAGLNMNVVPRTGGLTSFLMSMAPVSCWNHQVLITIE